MKRIINIALTLIMLGIATSTSAQNDKISLTSAQKAELELQVKQKVDDFLAQLKIIGSKKNSQKVKADAVDITLKLFIGNGNDYQYIDQEGNEKTHPAATMQTTSHRRGVIIANPPKPIREYLKRVMLLPYSEIDIKQVGAVRVDDLQMTHDGHYITTAYFYQRFTAQRDGRLILDDRDCKRITIYVDLVTYNTALGERKIWKIKLGDISATTQS